MENLDKEIVRKVKNLFENKADGKISPSKLKRQKALEDLSNRLFDFIEPVCWRTESNLAEHLGTSERQIKNAKAYLCLHNRITINLGDNKNRSNPRHYIVKPDGVQKTSLQETEATEALARETVELVKPQSVIKWEIFNTLTPKDFSLMTIEQQLEIYEEMNLPFIPLHFLKFKKDLKYCSCVKGRNCDAIGKHPAVFFKQLDFSKKSTFNEMKSHWTERDNRYNIGFLTKDFTVIDVDRRHGGDYSLEILEEIYGEFPRNLMVKTGNGFHIYTSSTLKMGVELLNLSGIDVRSKGGYVVAPSSQHHSKEYYEWQSLSAPEPLPAELLKDVEQKSSRASAASAAVKAKSPNVVQPKEWTKLPVIIDEGFRIPDGRRGHTLYQIACRERGRGESYSEILEVLEKVNACSCEPPVVKSRLESTAKSASSLPTNAEKKAGH
jgi:hypothetical protein